MLRFIASICLCLMVAYPTLLMDAEASSSDHSAYATTASVTTSSNQGSPLIFTQMPVYYNYPADTIVGVLAADMNGDTWADLVVTSNVVKSFWNLGNGTFDTAVSVPGGYCAIATTVGDYDGDGNLDWATALDSSCAAATKIILFENDGNGNVVNYDEVYVPYPPTALVSADFDKDGLDEIAVSIDDDYDDIVVVVKKLGPPFDSWEFDGTTYPVGDVGGIGILAADYNGDSSIDLSTLHYNRDNLLCVLDNNDSGIFTPSGCYLDGEYPKTWCNADFDGDGDIDLAVGNRTYKFPSVDIFANSGEGAFQVAGTYNINATQGIVAADFDLDGDYDLAFTGGDSVYIMLNHGDGTFELTETHILQGKRSGPLTTGDFNKDGRPDLAVGATDANYRYVVVFFNTPNWPPDTFSLVAPPNDSNTCSPVLEFSWDSSTDPEGGPVFYDLYISTSDSFPTEATYILDSIDGTSAVDTLPGWGTFFWKVKAYDSLGLYQWSNDVWVLRCESCCDLPGDANNDGTVNVGDPVFIINYVFKGGDKPPCLLEADANGDCVVNVGDAVYLINYVFKGGEAPICNCACCPIKPWFCTLSR